MSAARSPGRGIFSVRDLRGILCPALLGRIGILAAAMWPAPGFAANHNAEVTVVVSLTAAGRKLVPPTPEKPVYYFPVTSGWKEEGKPLKGEKPPPPRDFIPQLAKAMAREGYLLCRLDREPELRPTLLLVAYWGAMTPEYGDSVNHNDERDFFENMINREAMMALVSGHTGASEVGRAFGGINLDSDGRPLPPTGSAADLNSSGPRRIEPPDWVLRAQEAAMQPRYFIIVDAFDFARAQKGERLLLWRARISTPSQGIWFNDVAEIMIATGVPHFGRDTAMPVIARRPLREGRVDMGAPTVVKPADQPAKANEPTPSPESPRR